MKEELVDSDENNQYDSIRKTYYYSNHRGDVAGISDEGGSIKASYRYDAFGNIVEKNETGIENSLLFSSKRFNEAIGLSYFGARYYDAFIGRFISRDPMGYIDGPNQYIYVANNPLRYIDPLGLANWLIVVPETNIKNGNSDINIPDWSKGNSKFVKEFADTFGVNEKNTLTLMWSGANNVDARADGALSLTNLYTQIKKQDPYANIAVYGYSHGGNVIMESTSYGAKFNTVVTAGTPVRDDYLSIYNRNNVDTHIQFYDTSDQVQTTGGYNWTGYTNFEIGSASREIPGAQNIQVETGKDPYGSHIHFNDPNIFHSEIKPELQKTTYSITSTKVKRCP